MQTRVAVKDEIGSLKASRVYEFSETVRDSLRARLIGSTGGVRGLFSDIFRTGEMLLCTRVESIEFKNFSHSLSFVYRAT